jgi:cellulose biosynthesis protein BcsQ
MTETGTIKHLFDWIYSKEAELPREAGSLPITVPNWQAKVICGDMTLTNLEADLILRGQGVSDKIWQSLWRLNDSDLNLWPIIDCSPSYSYFTIAATSCAKGGIFIPVTTDEDSLYGISLTARAIHQLREFYREFNINPGKIRGIICNRVEPRRKLALLRALDYVIDDARAAYPESFTYNFKVLETMLIEDTNLFRTVRAAGKSIASLGPKAPMARLYNSLLEEVLELSQTNVDEY